MTTIPHSDRIPAREYLMEMMDFRREDHQDSDIMKLPNHLSIWTTWSLLTVAGLVVSCSGAAPDNLNGSGGSGASTGCAAGLFQCGAACVDLASDSANCGACGVPCVSPRACTAGVCACPGVTTSCGTACVDLTSDEVNCGVCGAVCGTGQECLGSACSCQAGLTLCTEGCVNTSSSATNCGACGVACAGGQLCSLGVCGTECAAGLTACSSDCADLANDVNNCGACGNACASGLACTGGVCSCATGQTLCGTACVNTQTDQQNCGTCGVTCTGGQQCVAGTCACPSGLEACSGQCVDTTSNALNCGTCGNQCPAGATCTAGTCQGGEEGTGGTGSTGGATFQIDLSVSPAIGSVGIVTWSVDVPIERASIQFGRQQGSWEYEAEVDLSEPNYRTLLLGMKPNTTYYVQIVAQNGSNTYTSEALSLQTDYLPNGLPVLNVTNHDESRLYGGFTINCTGTTGGTGMEVPETTYAFIFDRDGDMVWAYDLTDTPVAGCSRARMSFDGKHMWMGNFSNVSTDGAVMRVTMDGIGPEESYSLPGRHHDFSVLPNNHVLFQEQANGGGYDGDLPFGGSEGPDLIKELDPETGTTTLIYDESTDFSQVIADANGAHTNYVTYVPHLNAISFSMRHSSTIGLLSYPEGSLLAVFGGDLSDFDITWDAQHGHQVMENSILVFNNNGTNGGASVIEFNYDLNAKTASQIFDYSSGVSAPYFGDVQRLPNGNTFVTYSPTGVMHEIDASGTLLREVETTTIGYSRHRKTLYGPPPPLGSS